MKRDVLKLRPKELYIACEDMDFSWYTEEIKYVIGGWEEGLNIYEIAEELKRDPDEVLLLLIDLAKKEKILPRKDGIYGGKAQNPRAFKAII